MIIFLIRSWSPAFHMYILYSHCEKANVPFCSNFSTLCFGDGIGKWLTKEVTWALGHVCPSFFKDCPAITFRWKNPSKDLLAKSLYISPVVALVFGILVILEFVCGSLIVLPPDGILKVSKLVSCHSGTSSNHWLTPRGVNTSDSQIMFLLVM